MTRKKEKPIDLTNIAPEEKLKYEIAEELGLLDKVIAQGWRSLSAKETVRPLLPDRPPGYDLP